MRIPTLVIRIFRLRLMFGLSPYGWTMRWPDKITHMWLHISNDVSEEHTDMIFILFWFLFRIGWATK